MKVKTSELTGAALDWAVGFALCLEANGGRIVQARDLMSAAIRNGMASPSTNWAQGGPLLEGERILVQPEIGKDGAGNAWSAIAIEGFECFGPTPLIAAMRVFVMTKLGDEVDLPSGL